MKRFSMLLALSTFYTSVFSQQTGSIKGRVTDIQVAEPLPGATVTIKGTSNVAIANKEGYFTLCAEQRQSATGK